MLSRDEKKYARLLFRVWVRTGSAARFARLFARIIAFSEPDLVRLAIAGGGGSGNGDSFIGRGNAYIVFDARVLAASEAACRRHLQIVLSATPHQLSSLFIVCNHRYREQPEALSRLIESISASHPEMYVDTLPLEELEDLFDALPEAQTLELTGPIPRPSNLERLSPEQLQAIRIALQERESKSRSLEPFSPSEWLVRLLAAAAALLGEEEARAVRTSLAGPVAGWLAQGRTLAPENENDDWVLVWLLDRLANGDEQRQAATLAILGCLTRREFVSQN